MPSNYLSLYTAVAEDKRDPDLVKNGQLIGAYGFQIYPQAEKQPLVGEAFFHSYPLASRIRQDASMSLNALFNGLQSSLPLIAEGDKLDVITFNEKFYELFEKVMIPTRARFDALGSDKALAVKAHKLGRVIAAAAKVKVTLKQALDARYKACVCLVNRKRFEVA